MPSLPRRAGLVAALLLPLAPAVAEPLRWSALPVPGSGGRMTDIVQSPHDARRLLVLGDMLGIGLSRDGGASWGMSGFGAPSYEMGSATWHPSDPDVVWVGSMSGPLVSEDGGLVFRARRAGMGPVSDHAYSSPIEKVLFDPADETRLLAFGGSSRGWTEGSANRTRFGRVWESVDAGRSWRPLATLTPTGSVPGDATDEHRLNIVAMTWLGDRLVAAVRDGGIYLSDDRGTTWTKPDTTLPHGDVRRLAAHPEDGNVVWAALGSALPDGAREAVPGGIWKSVDGGSSWRASNTGLTRLPAPDELAASRYEQLVVSPHDPDRLVTGDAGWRSGTMFLSTDGGASWRPTARRAKAGDARPGVQAFDGTETPYRSGLGLEASSWSPTDPERLYAVGSDYMVESDDGGESFTGLLSERAGEPDAFGQPWRGTGFNGLVARSVVFDPTAPGKLIVQAMDAGRVWLTRDGGRRWTYHADDPMPWGGGRAAAFGGDGRHVYAALGQQGAFHGIARSLDGGASWEVVHGPERGLPALGGGDEPNGVAVDPRDATRVFASVDGTLYDSANGGLDWRALLSRESLGPIANHPTDPSRLLLAGPDSLIEVRIDGEPSPRSIGGPDDASDIATLPDGTVLATGAVAGRRPGLWRREVGGGRWTRLFDDPHAAGVTVLPDHPERLALTTDDDPFHDVTRASGPWFSDDGGASWTMADRGLPVRRGAAIAFDPHDPERLVLGTGGRGWFELRWPLDEPLEGD